MRPRRALQLVALLALVGFFAATADPAASGQTPPAAKAATKAQKIEAVLASLAPDGTVSSAEVRSFLRIYPNGKYAIKDGSHVFTGDLRGSKDLYYVDKFNVANDLLAGPGGVRALPISVRAKYLLDGQPIAAKDLVGKSGDVEIDITVVNRTLHTSDITYTDSRTGKPRTAPNPTMLPLSVSLSNLRLPDAHFDQVQTNGTVVRDAAGNATVVSWSTILAPPLYPGSATFKFTARALNFAMAQPTIRVQLGLSEDMPQAVSDALTKGGATAGTLRGYLDQFRDGFDQLNGGLGQIKGGVDLILGGLRDQLKPGLKAPNFDAAKYAEDSSLTDNQPGFYQGLQLLAGGLDKLKAGVGLVRNGMSTGDNKHPGIKEGLTQIFDAIVKISDGIGDGTEFDCNGDGKADAGCTVSDALAGTGSPLSMQAALALEKAGFTAVENFYFEAGPCIDPSNNFPACLGGLIGEGLGAGAKFSTICALLSASRGGDASGCLPLSPDQIAAIKLIATAPETGIDLGSFGILGGAPKKAWSKLLGGLGDGNEFDCSGDGVADVGCTVQDAVDGRAKPTTVRAIATLVRAGLAADAPAVSVKTGLRQILDGVGLIINGLGDLNPDGTGKKAVTLRTTKYGNVIEDPTSILWGLQSASDVINQKFIPGVQKILDALGDPNVKASTVLSGLSQISGGLQLTIDGTAKGRDGATTLTNVVGTTAVSSDAQAGEANTALQRAKNYRAFTTAPAGVTNHLVFLLSLPALTP